MPDEIQVGDVVWFDMKNPRNADIDQEYLAEQPFVVIKPHYPLTSHTVVRLDGRPFSYARDNYWSFYFHRFRKDVFLTEARRAVEEAIKRAKV